MTIPGYVSSHWTELGFCEEQARAYYDPARARPKALQALASRGLLQREENGQWRRLPAFVRSGVPQLRYVSPFQSLELYRSGASSAVFLNGTIQLEGRETRHHNEMMVALPLSLIATPRRVLVLGGGLGMGARLALEFANVESIQVVELDPDVVRLALHTRSLRQLNHKSLTDPRVKVWVGDAFQFMEGCEETYDLIVFDCDLTATRQSEELDGPYLLEFFRRITGHLSPGGGFSTRIPIDDGYMEIIETVGNLADSGDSDLQRAARLVRGVWPGSTLFEFLSLYCGRELMVLNFPHGPPSVHRRLESGSATYQRVLSELFG